MRQRGRGFQADVEQPEIPEIVDAAEMQVLEFESRQVVVRLQAVDRDEEELLVVFREERLHAVAVLAEEPERGALPGPLAPEHQRMLGLQDMPEHFRPDEAAVEARVGLGVDAPEVHSV